jgi:glycerate kinase
MIEHALDNGCKKIYLGLGGSATQDLGTGIVTALGGRFLDENGQVLPAGGGALHRLKTIDLSNINSKVLNAEWIVASDVQNSLLGKDGTAHTYAKQKGASPADIELLEQGGIRFAEVVKKQFGLDIRNVTGGGAAGGVSAGLYALLNAKLMEGFDLLAQHTGLKNKISKFDLILTGEGAFDKQSLNGKLPIQVARLAEKSNIPTLIVAGFTKMKSLKNFPNCKIINATPQGITIEKAIQKAENNLCSALTKELELIKSYGL